MEANERIIVALDVDSPEKAKPLVEQLVPFVDCFKIGLEFINSIVEQIVVPDEEEEAIENLKTIRQLFDLLDGKILWDGKFKDIPNTVAGASRPITRIGVKMFNVHCLGGLPMMMAAKRAVDEAVLPGHRPLILGVTILTSLNYDDLKRLGFREKLIAEDSRSLEELKDEHIKELVAHLAQLVQASGLDGVIASAKEIKAIRSLCRPDFLVVTPGTRPKWAAAGDQKRVTTPGEAIKAGADYLVIDRPITKPPEEIGSPIEAAKRIAEEIDSALKTD